MRKVDPRTKVILLLLTVIFSAIVPTGFFTCIWIALILLYGIYLGRIQKTLRAAITFAALWLCSLYFLPLLSGTAHTSLLVWLGLVFKCYPCCMIAAVMIGTTQIGEFMAAMAKWNIPRSVVIPLAIMFRYFPTLKEDWGHMKDAMALRGITQSPLSFLKNPSQVVDAFYLPILVTASKAADELSASAITRGIENPRKRTSRLEIRMGSVDVILCLLFLAALLTGMLVTAGGGN